MPDVGNKFEVKACMPIKCILHSIRPVGDDAAPLSFFDLYILSNVWAIWDCSFAASIKLNYYARCNISGYTQTSTLNLQNIHLI